MAWPWPWEWVRAKINRLCEFVNVDHGEEGLKCFAIHPGGVATALARNKPENMHARLVDSPELESPSHEGLDPLRRLSTLDWQPWKF